MPLADSKFFQRSQIKGSSFHTLPLLTEQAIHCLELVAELSASGLSFQFKGGTSLLLILDSPKRFSIDVDIATDENIEIIEKTLSHICTTYGVFIGWEKRVHKTKPWIPLSSYYLYYNSVIKGNASDDCYIMLDVQLQLSPYIIEKKAVCCDSLYECDVIVDLPSPGSIIGDKLLTIGPETLGIPIGKNKQAQRLKHVFDVGCLIEMHPSLNEIRSSFNGCIKHECELQKTSCTLEDIAYDTLRFTLSIQPFHDKPSLDQLHDPYTREICEGHDPFSQHLFQDSYSWDDMQKNMAIVAVVISAACIPDISDETLYNVIEGKYHFRNAYPLLDQWCMNKSVIPFLQAVTDWFGEKYMHSLIQNLEN